MRLQLHRALAGLLCFLPLALQAAGDLDRSYKILGGGLPIAEVYDDGQKSYVVVARNTDAKTLAALAKSLVVSRDGEERPATAEIAAPKLTIPGVYDKISLAVGGRRAVAIYMGSRLPAAPGKAPAEAVPAAPPALEKRPPAPERKEAGAAPAVRMEARREKPGAPEEPEIAEYKVLVPFAQGKATLGKEGEKAIREVVEIHPIAKSVLIRVPGEAGGNQQLAHGRAAEIYKALAKAGLARQRVVIEVVDAQAPGDGKTAQVEVTLLVDLPPAPPEKR